MKKIADGVPWTAPATIDDPASLEEISAEVSAIGYAVPRGGGEGRDGVAKDDQLDYVMESPDNLDQVVG